MNFIDNYLFNRSFFVRNEDDVFKLAVTFSRYQLLNADIQETLFFCNKEAIKNKINFLTFTEMYNETLQYTRQWLNDLDRVKDEFDWSVHRSKLITRFIMQKPINGYEELYKMLNDHNPEVARTIRNISILWNNSIFLAEIDKYSTVRKEEQLWNLWSSLLKYKIGEESIDCDKNAQKLFKKIVQYRNENKFYVDNREQLTPETLKQSETIIQDLSIIYDKENLDKKLPAKENFLTTIIKKIKL